jgi:transcriptional regulator of acetoin/glycerol metabolism
MKMKYEVGHEVFATCAEATLEQVDLLQNLYEQHQAHMSQEWKENLLSVIHLTQSHASVLFREIGL